MRGGPSTRVYDASSVIHWQLVTGQDQRKFYLQSLCITSHAQWVIVESSPDFGFTVGFGRQFQVEPNRLIGSNSPQPQQRPEPPRARPADTGLDDRGGSKRTGDAPDQTSGSDLSQDERLGDVGPKESRQRGDFDEVVPEPEDNGLVSGSSCGIGHLCTVGVSKNSSDFIM
jgi:hypothetical protein